MEQLCIHCFGFYRNIRGRREAERRAAHLWKGADMPAFVYIGQSGEPAFLPRMPWRATYFSCNLSFRKKVANIKGRNSFFVYFGKVLQHSRLRTPNRRFAEYRWLESKRKWFERMSKRIRQNIRVLLICALAVLIVVAGVLARIFIAGEMKRPRAVGEILTERDFILNGFLIANIDVSGMTLAERRRLEEKASQTLMDL